MDTSSFSISEDISRAPRKPGPGFKFPFGKKTVLPPVPLLPLQRGPRHRYTHAYALRTCKYGASMSRLTLSNAKKDADVVPC